jgi:sulfite oxidase
VGAGVYDVTNYVKAHPGGRVLLSAAGGAAEPFWASWPAHWDRADRAAGAAAPRASATVERALAPYRVATLRHPPGLAELREVVRDAYAEEPRRCTCDDDHSGGGGGGGGGNNALDVVTHWPFQGEPRYVGASYLTPNELFYVRNHGPVPPLPADRGACRVSIMGSSAPAAFSVAELEDEERFAQHTVAATLQCTGNRLDELSAAGGTTQFAGKAGSKGFISNAEWQGPRLVDVLAAAGVAPPPPPATPTHGTCEGEDEGESEREDEGWHLECEGADGFVISLPWRYATDPHRPVLLATRMNGEVIPPDHGAPVRCLVPGAVGARSVKWLVRVELIWGSSRSPWQRRFYRGGSSSQATQQQSQPQRKQEGREKAAAAAAAKSKKKDADDDDDEEEEDERPIMEWPVQGLITSVNNGDTVTVPSAAG